MTCSDITNLFAGLHKWAYRQDENFTTTALVYFLQHLLRNDGNRPIALRILQFIVEQATGCPRLTPAAQNVRVVMHQPNKDVSELDETGKSRKYIYPDIQIEYEVDSKHCLIYLEGKLGSKLYKRQKSRYLALKNQGTPERPRGFVLLAYHAVADKEVPIVRWFEIEDLLRKDIANLTDPIATFLASELLEFWRVEKRMYRDKVEAALRDELAVVKATKSFDNAPSVRNLFAMLEDAAASVFLHAERDGKPKKTMGRIRLWDRDKGRTEHNRLGTVVLCYDKPNKLEFGIGEYDPTPEHARALGFKLGPKRWYMEKLFGSEFFDLDKPAQRRWIEAFVKQCTDAAKELRAKSTGQPSSLQRPI